MALSLIANAGAEFSRIAAEGFARENLYQATRGLRAVHRRDIAAHHFDALNQSERNLLQRGSTCGQVVQRYTIDQHQSMLRLAAPNGNPRHGAMRTTLTNIDAHLLTQQANHIAHSRRLNVRTGNHGGRWQRIGDRLRGA